MGLRRAATRRSVPMMMTRLRLVLLVLAALLVTIAQPRAERMGYPPEEFAARRQKLVSALGRDGMVLMFGASDASPGVRFRQDNDFFYLTGSEATNAVLVMDLASGRSDLFMPKLSATQVRYEGGNWLDEPDTARKHAFASIQPLSNLQETLARRRDPGTVIVWTRLSERDEVNEGRIDTAISQARRLNNPFAQYPSTDAARI